MHEGIASAVINFVSRFVGVPAKRITPDTTLFGDLGIDGDDGDEFLQEFCDEFSVDPATLGLGPYFGPEGGCFPLCLFYWVVLWFRQGTAEERAGLVVIQVSHLIETAHQKRWRGP
ncbi:MAG: DUF1493 family protein [Planctomycetota bacterium]